MSENDVLLPEFALAVRGYDRQQVDDYVTRLREDLEEAHARAVLAERRLQRGDRAEVPPPPLPLTGLAASAGAPARRRPLSRVLTTSVAALALVAGAGAVAVVTSGDRRAETAAAAAPDVPSLPAVAAGVAARRDTAGPAVGALRGALRQLDDLSGVQRQSRALSLAHDVEAAQATGELTPAIAGLVRPTLLREAAPMDAGGLLEVLAVRPGAAGSEGQQVLEQLRTLGDPPDRAAAARLLEQVRTGAERGALTTAFRAVAVPVLEPLTR